ncbi:MAG: Crp/Fnr family transcriptional regulator [Kordiimonas sp.]|nr:Crp/Fnr family transcriptional regulator [Kordiimonas sp.]
MCNVLNDAELEKLNSLSSDFKRDTQQIICSEGEPADHLYNLRSGVIRLSKMLPDGRRQITGFLFGGDFLGLACNEAYAYTAEAITPVEMCRFPRHKLTQMFGELPQLGGRVFSMTSTELEAAQSQMLLLGRKTAAERLSSFLLSMAQKQHHSSTTEPAQPDADKQEVHLPMSRTDIADYLGLTVETVSRHFTKLAKSGLIDLQGSHKVILKDADALQAIADGDK